MKIELSKFKKWAILLLVIPFISIIIVVIFRHSYFLTNDEIIEEVKNAENYTSKVEYKIKNARGEYKENTTIYYSKEKGMRIEFEEDRVKFYNNGSIRINDNGYEYVLEGDFDKLYPLAFTNNLLLNEIQCIEEGSEEWGDGQYIEVSIELPFKNNHMTSAKLYINKEDKVPIVAKIYDVNKEERVTIIYKDFEYLKKFDEDLF
jgi:outer membrane lipoprotein-sorting protein